MINKKILKSNKGFTLIEVLIAIFILITAVVVPLTIGSKAFAYSNFVRDQSTASYLAQEAMEFVRLQRDNASLNPSPNGAWVDFKSAMAPCNGGGNNKGSSCYVTVGEKSELTACSGGGFSDSTITYDCPALYLQNDGTYAYFDSGINRYFVRSIQTFIENEGSANLERMRVTVNVAWNTNGISDRSFSVVNYLMPWQI